MSAEAFLDANILLYACSAAPQDATKRQQAVALMLQAPFALFSQVLQEFIANALRKQALGITGSGIDATLQLASQVRVLPVTLELILAGVALRRCYQLSHWDSTILAAAQELGCHTLYSGDLNHGQDYDGVRVLNPFR
jgi:predicted nucleic acid-binding protein